MAIPDALDSDSDYGYDFTLDEELELIQLASEASTSVRVASVIDSIPDQAESNPTGGVDTGARHAFSSSLESVKAPALQPQHPLPSAGTGIVYPDCA